MKGPSRSEFEAVLSQLGGSQNTQHITIKKVGKLEVYYLESDDREQSGRRNAEREDDPPRQSDPQKEFSGKFFSGMLGGMAIYLPTALLALRARDDLWLNTALFLAILLFGWIVMGSVRLVYLRGSAL